MISLINTDIQLKQPASKKITNDLNQFLEKGGKIKKIKSTNKFPKVYRPFNVVSFSDYYRLPD